MRATATLWRCGSGESAHDDPLRALLEGRGLALTRLETDTDRRSEHDVEAQLAQGIRARHLASCQESESALAARVATMLGDASSLQTLEADMRASALECRREAFRAEDNERAAEWSLESLRARGGDGARSCASHTHVDGQPASELVPRATSRSARW